MGASARKMKDAGPGRKVGPVTFARFSGGIEKSYLDGGVNPDRLSHVRRVLRMFHENGMQTTEDLPAVIKRIESKLEDATVAKQYNISSTIRAICNRAVELGMLESIPELTPVPHPSQVSKEHGEALSVATVQDILDHQAKLAGTWEGHRLYALAATVAFAGLKRDHALNLLVEDIDLAAGTIRVRKSKGMKRAEASLCIRFGGDLKPALELWLPLTECKYAFPGELRRGPWTNGGANQQLKALGEAVGLPTLGFEALRRFHEAHAIPTVVGLKAPAPSQVDTSTPSTEAVIPLGPRPELELDQATRYMAFMRGRSSGWREHRLYAFVSLALLQGLRPSEIIHLRTEDIDLRRSMARVAGRPMLTLEPTVAGILERWIGRPDRGDSPFAFPCESSSAPWSLNGGKGTVNDQLRQTAREAGIPGDITISSFTRLWTRHSGRISLGEAWQAVADPPLILDGPQQAHPKSARGPKPSIAWKGRRRPGTLQEFATCDPPRPAARIGESHDQPVFVRDVEMEGLTRGEHGAIRILLRAFPGGLSKRAMDEECGGTGWRRTLERLRQSHPAWQQAIGFPGDESSSGDYRILNA